MKTIESKKRTTSEMKTGTHLAIISDMFYLRDAAKAIHKIDGHPAIVVQFKDGKNQLHEQTYIIDGAVRQKYFQNMLNAAQVNMAGGSPQKSEVVGKRLWISICEVHYVNDDQVLLDDDGQPQTDYYIFRVYPYMENGKQPIITGDPAKNNGVPSGDFITYKNVSDPFTKEEVKSGANIVNLHDELEKNNPAMNAERKRKLQESMDKTSMIDPEAPSFDIDPEVQDDLDNLPQF